MSYPPIQAESREKVGLADYVDSSASARSESARMVKRRRMEMREGRREVESMARIISGRKFGMERAATRLQGWFPLIPGSPFASVVVRTPTGWEG